MDPNQASTPQNRLPAHPCLNALWPLLSDIIRQFPGSSSYFRQVYESTALHASTEEISSKILHVLLSDFQRDPSSYNAWDTLLGAIVNGLYDRTEETRELHNSHQAVLQELELARSNLTDLQKSFSSLEREKLLLKREFDVLKDSYDCLVGDITHSLSTYGTIPNTRPKTTDALPVSAPACLDLPDRRVSSTHFKLASLKDIAPRMNPSFPRDNLAYNISSASDAGNTAPAMRDMSAPFADFTHLDTVSEPIGETNSILPTSDNQYQVLASPSPSRVRDVLVPKFNSMQKNAEPVFREDHANHAAPQGVNDTIVLSDTVVPNTVAPNMKERQAMLAMIEASVYRFDIKSGKSYDIWKNDAIHILREHHSDLQHLSLSSIKMQLKAKANVPKAYDTRVQQMCLDDSLGWESFLHNLEECFGMSDEDFMYAFTQLKQGEHENNKAFFARIQKVFDEAQRKYPTDQTTLHHIFAKFHDVGAYQFLTTKLQNLRDFRKPFDWPALGSWVSQMNPALPGDSIASRTRAQTRGIQAQSAVTSSETSNPPADTPNTSTQKKGKNKKANKSNVQYPSGNGADDYLSSDTGAAPSGTSTNFIRIGMLNASAPVFQPSSVTCTDISETPVASMHENSSKFNLAGSFYGPSMAVNAQNTKRRPPRAEPVTQTPIEVGAPTNPFQVPAPESRIGSAMVHLTIEQLAILTSRPEFLQCMHKVQVLLGINSSATDVSSAIATVADQMFKSSGDNAFQNIVAGLQLSPPPGFTVNPAVKVQNTHVEPSQSFVEKYTAGMANCDIALPSGIKSQRPITRKVHFDTGASVSCISVAALARDKNHLLSQSKCKLVELQGVALQTFVQGTSYAVTQMLQNVRAHLGKGFYHMDFCVIPDASAEYLIGNDYIAIHDMHVKSHACRLSLKCPQPFKGVNLGSGGYQNVDIKFEGVLQKWPIRASS